MLQKIDDFSIENEKRKYKDLNYVFELNSVYTIKYY